MLRHMKTAIAFRRTEKGNAAVTQVFVSPPWESVLLLKPKSAYVTSDGPTEPGANY